MYHLCQQSHLSGWNNTEGFSAISLSPLYGAAKQLPLTLILKILKQYTKLAENKHIWGLKAISRNLNYFSYVNSLLGSS